MMLRLISALLFTAAGTAAGVMLSQRLAKEREICRETGDLREAPHFRYVIVVQMYMSFRQVLKKAGSLIV